MRYRVHVTYVLQGLVLLVQLSVHLHQLLHGLVKIILNLLDLLLQRSSLFLSLHQHQQTLEFYMSHKCSAYRKKYLTTN
jgi:hypothetical protein